jgi:hypothetical protein
MLMFDYLKKLFLEADLPPSEAKSPCEADLIPCLSMYMYFYMGGKLPPWTRLLSVQFPRGESVHVRGIGIGLKSFRDGESQVSSTTMYPIHFLIN